MLFSIADAVNADEDGIILLENLKFSGFISPNRWDRFDRDEVLAILKVGFQIRSILGFFRLNFFCTIHGKIVHENQ